MPRAALLEAGEVVGREARELGELLATQARSATESLAREADRRRRQTIAPRAQATGEVVVEHVGSIALHGSTRVALAVLVTRVLWWRSAGARTVHA